MTKKDITKIFIDETYSTPPMRIFPANELLHNHIDGI